LLYPLGYWNAVATWSAMAIAIGLSWSAHLRRPWLRATCLAMVPVAGVVDYLTYSRGGAVGAAVAVAAVLVLSRHRLTAAVHAAAAAAATGLAVIAVRSESAIANGTGGEGGGLVLALVLVGCVGCGVVALSTRRRGLDRAQPLPRVRVAIAAIGVGATIAVGSGIAANATDRFASGAYPANTRDPASRLIGLSGSRDELWSAAVGAFGSDPLKGTGPGTFEFWWARESEDGELVRDAHSLYLEAAGELGLPGLVLVLALLGGLLAGAIGGRRAANGSTEIGATTGLAAAFVVYLFATAVDWAWETAALTVLALGAAAVAGAPSARPRWRPGIGPRAGIVALAVAAGALQVPGIVSTERMRAGSFELALGNEQKASELAGDAIAAEPWSASPHALRAFIELSAGDLDAARSDALAAVEREPTNWRHQLLLARIEAVAGREASARMALAEVARLRASVPDGVEDRPLDLDDGS
jgi:hypothetical protein